MTTLFIITLPIECERIERENDGIPKSVALGCFVAISGFTQLISPLAGMLSDTYRPPRQFQLGQRMPFLCLGAVLSVFGMLGEFVESYHKMWIPYSFFFFFHMIGLNITYAMTIALIPDQVPRSQTGTANGILAFLLVTGSLAGFGYFHLCFNGIIQDMYGLYICVVVLTTILTALYAHDKDVQLFMERLEISRSRRMKERRDSLPKGKKTRNNKKPASTSSATTYPWTVCAVEEHVVRSHHADGQKNPDCYLHDRYCREPRFLYRNGEQALLLLWGIGSDLLFVFCARHY
mmetsp:Transcript_3037/g.6441  ORF Transcript_3037/g.6441 Transcript_3037/m.6441 type:complete len:291 (-) Transcript_3037:835-1707(-)